MPLSIMKAVRKHLAESWRLRRRHEDGMQCSHNYPSEHCIHENYVSYHRSLLMVASEKLEVRYAIGSLRPSF